MLSFSGWRTPTQNLTRFYQKSGGRRTAVVSLLCNRRLAEICPVALCDNPPMKTACSPVLATLLLISLSCAPLFAQAPAGQAQQPEFVKQGQQLMHEGKLQEALTLFRQTLQTTPLSLQANLGAGIVLDLMGQGEEARKYFSKAIDVSDTPERKAAAQRAMAMSYAFEGNCKKTIEYEKKVMQYDIEVKNVFQQSEIFDKGSNPEQAPFFPYLKGYVAYYAGDYKSALEEFLKANQNDPFIECLTAQTYEKLGDKDKALEFYRKASSATSHNPPAAYAVPFSKKKLEELAH